MHHVLSQSNKEFSRGTHPNLYGKGGKAYLLGDENISWKNYLELFFSRTGNPVSLDISTDEHPMFPDILPYAGRNAVIHYEPDQGDINYSRNNIFATVDAVVKAYL